MFKMEFIRGCPAVPDEMVAEMLKRNPIHHARWPGLRQLNKLPQTIRWMRQRMVCGCVRVASVNFIVLACVHTVVMGVHR